MPREAQLARTLVELTSSLTTEFDAVDVLTTMSNRCVEVLDVATAGVMLASPGGDLRVVSSSSDAMRVLELFEEQSHEGPCQDCYRTGTPILNVDLQSAGGRWPEFGPKAFAAGFRSVHALPMRLRDQTIGALNLFRVDDGRLEDQDVAAAQAFADVATIVILQNRAIVEASVVNDQLRRALQSRVVIEQAKGVIAQASGVGMDLAFARMRRYARSHNLRLAEVARSLTEKALAVSDLDP